MKWKPRYSKKFYLRVFWTIFALPFITLFIILLLVSQEAFGPMPTFEDLENPENNLASQVYSQDGKLLGKYWYQNRTYVDFKEVSSNIVNALIATEDIRFYEHSGIDARGLARVFFKTLLMGRSAGGGSTITQQLAKNLFPRDTTVYDSKIAYATNLVLAKFKEWITAVKLERNYTKKEILVMYLNTVPFGGQSYGIKSAAKTYYNTHPDSLHVEEAATLIGLLKAPTRYSPVLHPERSRQRRNIVLGQMNKYNYISDAEFDSLSTKPLNVKYQLQDHNVGPARYFREHLRTMLTEEKPIRDDYVNYESYQEDSTRWANDPLYGWCNKNKKPDGSHFDIYRDGLKIHTTINSKMQKYAENAVEEHLSKDLQQTFFELKKDQKHAPFSKNLKQKQIERIMNLAMKRTHRYYLLNRAGVSQDSIREVFNEPREMKVFTWEGMKDTVLSPMDSIRYYKYFLRAGFMSMNPQNGHVKAYVGGPNFKFFKYDHVTQGARQVGSTIKPFLYTVAMQEGYSPCHRVPNIPRTFYINDSTWTPKNSGPTDMDGEMVTLKWGLTNSVNWISAWLVKQFNAQAVVDIMRKLGIESYIDPVPSIFLGTSDIKLSEMVGAYSSYANEGVHIQPQFITRIEDRNGNVLATFKPRQNEAISEQTAYLMINLLKNVVKEGTGIRLRYKYQLMNSIAGKTGTTQNQSDGWFMGVTPNLVSGAWVGGEDRSIHFNSITYGQGANMALPIWALYMKKIYNDSTLTSKVSKEDEFKKPNNFNYILDCEEYERKNPRQNRDESDFF